MSVFRQFIDAATGWFELGMFRPGWQGRFVQTRDGFVVAIGGYFAVVVLGILLQGLVVGAPGPAELLFGIAVNALPLVGVVLAIVITTAFLRLEVPAMAMAVPAIHAVTLLLILGFAMSPFGAIATVLLGVLGYLLYRGGQEILGLKPAFALAYAALSVVLLVALPSSLYMLLAPGPGGPI